MALLEATDLRKQFGGILAVRGIDLRVEEGEFLGLFGPNGAGKTTLFNLIAGAYRVNSGAIRFDGRDITGLPSFSRARLGIGRTFQVVRPFRDITVIENLLAAVPRQGVPRGNDIAVAYELLRRVGLDARADDLADTLTLGMLKRLEVARSLATHPRLLLLDEPLAGLTSGEAEELLDFVGSLRAQLSIIMVEHNVRLALSACDRAIVMEMGAVTAEGRPDEIRQDPRVIRAYLGEDAG